MSKLTEGDAVVLGCSGGPTLAGAVASIINDNIRIGIGAAIVFPVIMGISLAILNRRQ